MFSPHNVMFFLENSYPTVDIVLSGTFGSGLFNRWIMLVLPTVASILIRVMKVTWYHPYLKFSLIRYYWRKQWNE